MPDVGPGAHLQAYLLPTNLADREGGWKPAEYFDTNGFLEVAVGSINGQPYDAAHPERGYKVLLPLLDLRRGLPTSLDATGEPIYEFCPYLVVELTTEQLLRLDADWRTAHSAPRRAMLARRVLAEHGWPDLQEHISQRLSNG
jgi:hypothetical protein